MKAKDLPEGEQILFKLADYLIELEGRVDELEKIQHKTRHA